MSVAAPFLHQAQGLTDLEDWGALDEATGSEMQTSGVSLWKGEGDQSAGVWECTAGPSHWTLETNEFVYVMSGSMTVTSDGDGEPVTLKAGDTILIPRGWSGAWEIHETLRKLYVIF